MFVICPKCGAKYQIPPEISLNYGQKMQCSACGHYFVLNSENSLSKNESIEKQKQVENEPILLEQKENKPEIHPVLPEVFQPSIQISKKSTSLLLPFLLVVVSLMILLILLALAWQYRTELQFQNKMDSLYLNRTTSLRTPEKPVPVSETSPIQENKQEVEAFLPPLENNEPLPENTVVEKHDSFSFRALRFHLTDGQMGPAVQIEGIIRNEQTEPALLPTQIYINAYDGQGQILFQKEIFFTQKSLMPNQEQAFFGTYSPAPKEIKWIDASFQK